LLAVSVDCCWCHGTPSDSEHGQPSLATAFALLRLVAYAREPAAARYQHMLSAPLLPAVLQPLMSAGCSRRSEPRGRGRATLVSCPTNWIRRVHLLAALCCLETSCKLPSLCCCASLLKCCASRDKSVFHWLIAALERARLENELGHARETNDEERVAE